MSPKKWRPGLVSIFKDPVRRRFAAISVLVIAASLLFGSMLGANLSLTWRVLVDSQERTCLPFRVAVVKLGQPKNLKVGDYVAMIPRGRLGMGIDDMVSQNPGRRFIVKQVAGLPGDVLVVKGDEVFINGKSHGRLDLLQRLGKPSGAYDRQEVVPPGSYLLFGTLPRSYDSRYWGPAPLEELVGVAYPIY